MSTFTMSPSTASQEYAIDPAHTRAHFSVRHMMISNVKGEFTRVSGKVVLDPAVLAQSHVEAVIDASSLQTGDEQRDAHLKSADFLDVANHPEIRFVSKHIELAGEGEHLVKGNLTIRGVTKLVTLKVEGPTAEFKDPWGSLRVGATATTKIDRKDFGLVWNVALEAGGILVGETVSITIDVELTRAA